MYKKYNTDLTPRARQLRKAMTPEERKLWYDFLCHYPVKFLRQKPIDHFIVDFYCSKAKLIIELDGSGHFTEEGRTYDEERTQILETYDLHVIRFTNSDIMSHFVDVCNKIDDEVKKRIVN